jgi:hypothetical protein
MPNQDYFAETDALGVIDPRSEIQRVLACYTPIVTAADSLPEETVFFYVSKVVHPRIACDGGIASIRQGSGNPNITRIIEIYSPSVNPDHRDRLGNISWRSEKRASIDDVVFGADVNELLRKLPRLLVFRVMADSSAY